MGPAIIVLHREVSPSRRLKNLLKVYKKVVILAKKLVSYIYMYIEVFSIYCVLNMEVLLFTVHVHR